MTSLALADLSANDNPRLQVGKIQPGWYLVAVTHERLKKDRTYVTALAYVPCPLFTWAVETPLRAREPVIEIDGREVPPEDVWEAWISIAHFPIDRDEFMRRRGLHAGW